MLLYILELVITVGQSEYTAIPFILFVLIYDLPLKKYQSFSWDGRNKNGKKCSSGVYFYTISNNKGETKRGKIALIRD